MDKIDKRLFRLESICNVYNDEALYKPVIAMMSCDIAEIKSQLTTVLKDKTQTNKDVINLAQLNSLSTEIAEIKSQVMKLQQNGYKTEQVNIVKTETHHVNKDSKNAGANENFEANIELLKSQLKKLHNDMNIKINNKSKEQRDELNKYIQAITKDAHATPSGEQMRSFAEYVAASSSENKSELLKLQLKIVEHNQKTVGTIQELKSIVEIASENTISVDKYLRLEKIVLKLTENSATKDYVDELVKQKLIIETGELQKLSTKLQQLDTKNNEMQCFVDEMAKSSDPDVKKDYEFQLTVVKTMQEEIAMQKKTLLEKIREVDETLNQTIMQMVSVIVDR